MTIVSMLISQEEVLRELQKRGIIINGVFHIGAHECEELDFYKHLGVKEENMVWIDGNEDKVKWAKNKGIQNVYKALISEYDDKEIEFHITNNGQSSSILELGTHQVHHPHVYYTETRKDKSVTIDTFFTRNNLSMNKYDFWNFDIQGAELMALKGATNALEFPKAIYLEVNMEELYKGCGLLQEIDHFMTIYGFNRVLTKITEYGWGDALYLKV